MQWTKMVYVTLFTILTMINGPRAEQQTPSPSQQREDGRTFTRGSTQKARGGSTIGPAVTYDNSIPSSWVDLHQGGITDYERDRRAILALAGNYEVQFEFIEAFLMNTSRALDIPYISKATEFVRVIENREDFISLQHILVMFFQDGDQVHGPMVTKHWRQDWQWEGDSRFVYQGDNRWNKVPLDENERQGQWVWSVFQVDDSPRYTGVGEWKHYSSASVFETDTMSRPLPRREFSVRDDYKLLMGRETLILTPNTWYHEQNAFKHKNALLNGEFNGQFSSREIGQNTYRRIKSFDWSAGEDYWNKTAPYWSDVRTVWNELLIRPNIQLRKQVDGVPLYGFHFVFSEDPRILAVEPAQRQKLIRTLMDRFIISN